MPLVAPERYLEEDIEERRSSQYAAGRTRIDSNGALIMPPTISEAMRRMISEPVPLSQ